LEKIFSQGFLTNPVAPLHHAKPPLQ